MLRQEGGQVTVFLALTFFILLGAALCVLEGMYSYMESSLAEDAVKGAGNYVLANYDRNLFERYHLFFLDPRERERMETDGKEYLAKYLDKKSFFRFSCRRLDITDEKTAVDEDGLYLKHQIREWMKYREVAKAGESLKELLESARDARTANSLAKSDMGEAESAIRESENDNGQSGQNGGEPDAGGQSGSAADGAGGQNDGTAAGQSGNENNGSASDHDKEQTGGKTGIQWKDLKELLTNITRSGILVYVTDDVGEVSTLSVDTENLPSVQRVSEKEAADFFSGALSFLKVDEWKKLLGEIRTEEGGSRVLADEVYLLEYIEDNFASYVDENDKVERALKYETEYLIAGKASDMDNLKAVADRILCLRFLSNYMYLSQNSQWKAASGSAAAALTGILGFPQAKKAVQVLLTAAVSFGESMLDVHALFTGEEVPVMKDASTWNLTLENAVSLLKNRGPVKKGNVNADYEDYLKLFLLSRMERSAALFRMMDIMQLNVALEEPGFLMEKALFAFRWEAEFSCGGWFTVFPGTGQSGTGGFTVELDRMNSY